MSTDNLIGWELLYHSLEKPLTKKEDFIVALFHWCLVKSGFQCLGFEENESPSSGSELLPKGWNKGKSYALKYVLNGNKPYMVKGSISGQYIILELVHVEDMTIAALTLATNKVIPEFDFNKPLPELMPDYKTVLSKMTTELITKLTENSSKEVHTQTNRPSTPPTSTHFDQPVSPVSVPPSDLRNPGHRDVYADPFNIGRSDLDPLGRIGGGGMLYDPFRPLNNRGLRNPDNLPRFAVPPGARYDVIGPQAPGRRAWPPPDPDHFPPPNSDHMYL